MKRPSQLLVLTLLAALLVGCETLSYYRQAVGGHLSLMMSGRPSLNCLKTRIRTRSSGSSFDCKPGPPFRARERLDLPVGDSYTEYVELDRPWVLVNLISAPEFSLEARQWCYPFVGCQTYRGYFDIRMARSKAREIRAEGYDTFIGGVTAYSTLGWFDDPLHSGFTALEESRMVALIFHELAHRVLYVDGDTAFNEGFATAVELEGLRLWAGRRETTMPLSAPWPASGTRDRPSTLWTPQPASWSNSTTEPANSLKETLRERKERLLRQLIADYRDLSRDWDQPGPLGEAPRS